MDQGESLERVKELAGASLGLWPLPADARVRLLNVSENCTFLVEHGEGRHILRIHREGYHSRAGIASELAWLHALKAEGGVITPQAIPGRDGEEIQEGVVEGLPVPRHMVLFDFIEGTEPDETAHDLVEPFRRLGEVSARVHLHSAGWTRPPWFERLVWDAEHVFGPENYWGDWREGPGVTAAHVAQLQKVEDEVVARLTAHGRAPDRFGLAHCDLRLANLLIVGDSTRVIDFDDCGLSWFLYDLATALTLIDDLPQTPALVEAWLAGYTPLRPLSDEDLAIVPTLMMMRRMAILAWMGTHTATDLTRDNRTGFADATSAMAEAWLARPPSADDLVPWRS